MSLARKEIRDSLFEMLKSSITSGVKCWSKNRFRPYWEEDEVPGVAVYTIQENAEIFNTAPRRYRKRLQIAVEIVMQGNDDMDDDLDLLCGAIENVIYLDETLGGKASDCQYVSTEIIEKPEGQKQTGSAVMIFEAQYYEYAPAERELKDYLGGKFTFKSTEAPLPDGTPKAVSDYEVDQEST